MNEGGSEGQLAGCHIQDRDNVNVIEMDIR